MEQVYVSRFAYTVFIQNLINEQTLNFVVYNTEDCEFSNQVIKLDGDACECNVILKAPLHLDFASKFK